MLRGQPAMQNPGREVRLGEEPYRKLGGKEPIRSAQGLYELSSAANHYRQSSRQRSGWIRATSDQDNAAEHSTGKFPWGHLKLLIMWKTVAIFQRRI